MSRRDDLHFPVRRALEKEGWTITHDPIVIGFRDLRLKVDLGAERYFAAEKEGWK
ncbi:MAG: element excision factor XisH family protein, partial [Blastocatellia bacterium]